MYLIGYVTNWLCNGFRIISESPRWLLSQGRKEKAIKYFYKSARINNVDIPKNLVVYLEYQVGDVMII